MIDARGGGTARIRLVGLLFSLPYPALHVLFSQCIVTLLSSGAPQLAVNFSRLMSDQSIKSADWEMERRRIWGYVG